jgi:hypothetical protein
MQGSHRLCHWATLATHVLCLWMVESGLSNISAGLGMVWSSTGWWPGGEVWVRVDLTEVPIGTAPQAFVLLLPLLLHGRNPSSHGSGQTTCRAMATCPHSNKEGTHWERGHDLTTVTSSLAGTRPQVCDLREHLTYHQTQFCNFIINRV